MTELIATPSQNLWTVGFSTAFFTTLHNTDNQETPVLKLH